MLGQIHASTKNSIDRKGGGGFDEKIREKFSSRGEKLQKVKTIKETINNAQ